MASILPFIQFLDGETRSNKVIYIDPELYVVAPNEVLFAFNPVNGDRVAENYQVVNDVLEYSPPAPPDPILSPDVDGFTNAIWAQPALRPMRLQLVAWKPMLVEYLSTDPTRIVEAWEDIKAALPAEVATAVEQLASSFNIQLV